MKQVAECFMEANAERLKEFIVGKAVKMNCFTGVIKAVKKHPTSGKHQFTIRWDRHPNHENTFYLAVLNTVEFLQEPPLEIQVAPSFSWSRWIHKFMRFW